MALQDLRQQERAEWVARRRAVWVAYDAAVVANGQAVRALNRARAESAVCAEAVYRLHRLEGPQTATRLQALEEAWQAWDAATAVVIAAEAAAAAAVSQLEATPRPGRASC